MSEFEKAQKNLKNDMLALFVLELIIFIFLIINNSFNFLALIFAIMLFVGYLFAKKGQKTAGIIGIIVGILMMTTILSGDLIDFLLGLFVLIHSVKYNKLTKVSN